MGIGTALEETTAAEAWWLIASIIRRHPRQECLRVVELHPGGGQGHVLALLEMGRSGDLPYKHAAQHLVHFNLVSGAWALEGPDYPDWQPWRSAPRDGDLGHVLQALLRALHLEDEARPLDPRISGLVFLAEILGSPWGRANGLVASMAYTDTSGYGGGIRRELLQFSALYPPRELVGEDWQDGLASGFWLLTRDVRGEVIGAIGMNGELSAIREPQVKHELYRTYAQCESIDDVLAKARSALSGAPPAVSVAQIQQRVAQAAFGRPLITNVLRGQVVEAMIAFVLEPEWQWCSGDYAGWDFERRDGLRLEVKQSSARQSWASPKPSSGSFDIKVRKGRWEGSLWIADERRHADIYVFAWHGVSDDSADHRDPEQWTFYVVATEDLPKTQRIGLASVRVLATPCGYDGLAVAVTGVAAKLKRPGHHI